MTESAPNMTQGQTPERVTRCVVLQQAGPGEPVALFEALRHKPVRIDTVNTPARAMAEIARHEIEFRHQAQKLAQRQAEAGEAEAAGRPVVEGENEGDGMGGVGGVGGDPREPLVLLAIDPDVFDGEAERMSGAIAHYFPQVVQWIYRTDGNPRLEPWQHDQNQPDPGPRAERVASAKMPVVETRPVPSITPRPTAAPATMPTPPSLRLTATETNEPEFDSAVDEDSFGFDDGIEDHFAPPPLDPPSVVMSPSGFADFPDELGDEDLDEVDEGLNPPLVSPDELAMLLDDDEDEEDDFRGGVGQ